MRSLLAVFLLVALPTILPAQETGRDRLWANLASADAAEAYRALWGMARTPPETVAYVTGKLAPAVAPDPRMVATLIEQLNSDSFSVREKANQELTRLGNLAGPALHKANTATLPLEVRQRVEKLVNRLAGPLTFAEHLREVRTVELLEQLGTDDSRKLLARFAGGAVHARLTREAQAALARVARSERALPAKATARVDLYGDTLPDGAVARLGTLRYRGGGEGQLALAFLPDGKTLVTASQDRLIQAWDVASGRLVHKITTGPAYIQGFALAPDGKHFAVAGSHPPVGNKQGPSEVQVFAYPSGNLVRTFPRATFGNSWELAFSPDSTLLFSLGSRDGLLRIEEISSGTELAQRKFPSDNQGGLALSPNGAQVAVASGPNTHKVFLWTWRDGEPRQLAAPERGVRATSFSPDGKLLAGLDDSGILCLWETPGGRKLAQQDSEKDYTFQGKPVFTPDGKSLAVMLRHRRGMGRHKIQLLDPGTGRVQAVLAVNYNGRLAISDDGRTLGMTAGRGVRFWDLATRTELSANDQAHDSDPTQIVVSPKGFLVSAGDDNSVRVWDAVTSSQRRKFAVDYWVRAISLSPDGNLLAASSFDDLVHVWDTHSGREIYRLAGHGRYGGKRTLGFLPDGRGLLSWGDDLYLRLWDMKTGKARLEHAIRPEGVKIPDDDDRRSGRAFDFMLGNAALTPDGKTFVLDLGGNHHVFDTASGKRTSSYPSEGRLYGSATISADSKHLLTSAYGDYRVGTHPVALVDLASGKSLQHLMLPGSSAGPVAFSADGRTFAVSVQGDPGAILLYEAASGNVRCTIRGFPGKARALAFFPEGRRLASGLTDSTIVIWDLTAPELFAKGP